MNSATALSLTILLVATAPLAADQKNLVFQDSKPADKRLTESHDLDHPWVFDPSAFKDKSAWQSRAAQVREQVLVAEGLWPLPQRTPLNPVIHGKVDRDDYTIEKVFFASRPGHYVSGNLYRPKGKTGKLPAVLFAHGHWNNARFFDAGEKEA